MGIAKPTESKLLELRDWLDDTGTTQEDLARLLSVSPAQVSRFMNGSRSLSVESAVKLALLTDIPVDKLLTDGRAARLLKLLGKNTTSRRGSSKEKKNVA